MSDLASNILLLSLLVLPVEAIGYLAWSGGRRYRASVAFESTWGIALSWPGFVMAFGIGSADGPLGGSRLVSWLLSGALACCWALAIAGIAGRRIPPRWRWLPLATAMATFVGYTAMYPAAIMYFSYFGFGLAAWICVGVEFARAVRHQHMSPIPTGASGFDSIFAAEAERIAHKSLNIRAQ